MPSGGSWALRRRLSKKGLGRNAVLALCDGVFGIGSYFLVMRWVIATAGAHGLGLWSLTMGYIAFIRLLDLCGVNGLARLVALSGIQPSRKREYIDTATVCVVGFFSIIGVLAYEPLKGLLSANLSPDNRSVGAGLLVWALLSLPVSMVGVAQARAIDGLGRSDVRSAINISGYAAFCGTAIFLVLRFGLFGLACAQFLQYLVILIGGRAYIVTALPGMRLLPTSFSIPAAREVLGFGLRLQFASTPMAVFDPLARIVINSVAGLAMLGIYDLSYKIAANSRSLVQAALNTTVPEFSRLMDDDRGSAKDLHARVFALNSVGTMVVFCGIIAASPLLSIFLFSHISDLFIFSVAVLSLAWGLTTIALPTQLYARSAGVLRWTMLGQWSMLICGGLLLFMGASRVGPLWSIVGIAVAILIGHLASFVLETRWFGLHSSRKGNRLQVVGSTVVLLVVAATAIAVSLPGARSDRQLSGATKHVLR